jgi:DNA-directed RNA polymerase I subunit RPA2
MAPAKTDTNWTVNYDTLRRERLFKNPPKDHTAYPSLAETIKPHVDSFNALFEDSKVLEAGLKDIGTKTFVDGEAETPEQKRTRQEEGRKAPKRNKLHVRIKEVFLEKPAIPPTNKFTTRNRNIYPSECRERHATYRGKLRARIEYRVNNGDWMESIRELGQVPIMMRVSSLNGPLISRSD